MSRALCLLFAVLMAAAFSGCAGINPFQEEQLLRPPRLTAEQKEIEDALLRSVNSSELTFKYPKSGEHRSAFIFQDIDADGQEEALVFYVTPASDSTFLSVLDRMPDGRWQSPTAIAGAEENVDFISFANLTDTSRCDILVGWSDPTGQQKRLNVYSFLDNRLQSRFSDGAQSYKNYLVANLDVEPLSDLVLLSRDSSDTLQIGLYAHDGVSVKMMDSLPLSEYMVECAGMTAGRLSRTDSRIGIFIDEMVDDGQLVTEVFLCESVAATAVRAAEKHLKTVIWENMVAPVKETTVQPDPPDGEGVSVDSQTLYDLTRRSGKTDICGDVDGDGVIEIPTGKVMPGYEEYDDAERFYLTQYKRLLGNTLEDVFSVAINWESGYQVKFPTEWVDQVTVVNQLENNEWRFISYNSQLQNNPLEDWSSELMRIRVVSQKDYQDRSLENYNVLALRGSFTYYGYIPETANGTLGITATELKQEMFSLMERKGVLTL